MCLRTNDQGPVQRMMLNQAAVPLLGEDHRVQWLNSPLSQSLWAWAPENSLEEHHVHCDTAP